MDLRGESVGKGNQVRRGFGGFPVNAHARPDDGRGRRGSVLLDKHRGDLGRRRHGALGGGGTMSLKLDAQGKTLSSAMLRMELEVTEDEHNALH